MQLSRVRLATGVERKLARQQVDSLGDFT